ncbi:MAG: PQQ-binding-like beta-propeller repeat protein [Planctomycetes bacterium]|jgi:outer membrane protein assembly factor BamB|nr:PQQ-binding-like beta-propeller repeat protein [Planctomycetota bacterium]
MKRLAAAILLAVFFLGMSLPIRADWLQFRGPGGLGIAPDKNTPIAWSAEKNVAWKTALPGPGASSPIIVGNKILVTCYSGYGLNRDEPGEQKNLKRQLVCVDRQNGTTLWARDLEVSLPEPPYQSFITLHGYASNTAVSDGKNVWVFTGRSGVFAFDLDGKQLWHTNVGTGTYYWGVGLSPILYKNTVIINASTEGKAILALDKATGKEVWKTKGINESWSTPVLVPVAGGKTELVVSGSHKILGFDPETGKELWHSDSFNWYVCPTVIAHAGVVYTLQNDTAVAVKAGGRGDVTKTHTVWQKSFGATVTSMVFHDGHVYWANRGVAYCLKASDGTQVYRERLKAGGEFYASPLLADGKLYFTSRNNGVYVLDASPKFKVLAHNTLDDKSVFNASPAVSQSQLILRSDKYLYCIGVTK